MIWSGISQANERAEFKNYDRNGFDIYNHTEPDNVSTYSQLLNGGINSQIGLAKTLSVMPGDTIEVEVYAKYRNVTGSAGNLSGFAAALTSAFGLSSGMIGDPGLAYGALDDYGAIIASGFDHSDDLNAPKAYLNILLFDKNYNFVDAAYKQIDENYYQTDAQTTAGIKAPHGLISRQIVVPTAGYAYIFLSNENPGQMDVYFDDLKIRHAKSPVIQMDDYYPFGLTFNSYWRENGLSQQYLYNGKELQDELEINWSDYGARMYLPEIGRWGVIDPLADQMRAWSPCNYAFNNPILLIDYDGMAPGDPQGEVVKKESVIDLSKARNITVSETTVTALPTETRTIKHRNGNRTIVAINKVQTTQNKTTFSVSAVESSVLNKDLKVSTEGTIQTEVSINIKLVDGEGKVLEALTNEYTQPAVKTNEMGELAQGFSEVIGDNPNNVPGLSFKLSSANTAYEIAKFFQGATETPSSSTSKFAEGALNAMQSGLDPKAVEKLKSKTNNSKIVE